MTQTYTTSALAEITISINLPGQESFEISGLTGRAEFGLEMAEEMFGGFDEFYSFSAIPTEFKLSVTNLQRDENGSVFTMKIGETNEYVGTLAELLHRVGIL